ncbi:Holliday junction branch migration protein RuvA [soil metagenome]
MIASVSGEVLVRRADHVVVDAHGVGYRLSVSAETLKAVSPLGGRATLHSHLVPRDDALNLYGFATEDERDLFLNLISVSGVGPKVALAALSGGPVRELLLAIASGDAKRFQAVPGIGKRTAERIIVELREKIAGELEGDGEGITVTKAGDEDPRSMAREGLLNLGYTPPEAERLLDRAEGDTAEDLIQSALHRASGAKAA